MFLQLNNALLKERMLQTLPSIFFEKLIFRDVKVRMLHVFVLLLLTLVKLFEAFCAVSTLSNIFCLSPNFLKPSNLCNV